MKYGNEIKTARKILGLNQDNLANDNLSRNLISDIEKDKINLVPSKALIIYKALIEEAAKQEKNIKLNFDELLGENEVYKNLRNIYSIYLELIESSNYDFSISKLKNYKFNFLRHDIGLLKYYVLLKVFEITPESEIEFRTETLMDALAFLRWEVFNKIQVNFRITLEKITPIANRLGKQEELIYYYKYYEDNMIRSGHSINPKIYYNLALFYKKIENYSEAYNYLERTLFFSRDLPIEKITDILNLKGNVCIEIGKISEGIETYQEVMTMLEFSDLDIPKSYALSNLLYSTSINQSDVNVVKGYLVDLLNLLPKIRNERKNLNVLYRNIAISYNYVGDFENSQKFMKISFDECTTNSDSVDLLYEYYKHIQNVMRFNIFYEQLISAEMLNLSEKDKNRIMSIVLSIIGNDFISSNDERANDFKKYIIKNYGGIV